MKRYLWVLLLAACTAPTGEVTKAVKVNENTKTVETSQEVNRELTPEIAETEVTTPETEPLKKPETKIEKTVEKKTLTGTYFGIRKLEVNEYKIDSEDEDSIPNDRRLALTFDESGKAGWGDADDENTAKKNAQNKQYTYELNDNIVTVKQNNGILLVLELRNNNQFIYITEDNTDKISQLNVGVKYTHTGLALNGVEVQGGHGSGSLANRVNPPIPPFKQNKF